jgi:class 3 adenylate cyclase/tetratricopeptide (TPR) repeat protein
VGRRLTEGPVTILISDVEGSTALHSARGDAEAQTVLGICDSLVRQQVRDHRGRAIKSTGDGLLAVFTSPRKAVECALAIQQAVIQHGDQHPHQQVRVRVGLHAGEISEVAGDIHGSAVNAAARICGRAHGGEVLVSEVVRQLCGPLPDTMFTERGRVTLKGFPERWRLYGACADPTPAPVAAPGRTPFVGREAERAELRALIRSGPSGRGALVLIGGEPGVGKTRLSQAVVEEAHYLGFHTAVGHSYDGQGDLPYMPWVEIIEAAARETPREGFREALGESAPEMARIVPQLRQMFDDIPPPMELPPDQQRRYTFASTREYIARVASRKPQLMVLEDLHWADESTLLFLEYLAELLPAIPLVVIGTYRDPPIDVSPRLAQALSVLVRHQARRITLRRHSDAEVSAMLRALTGHSPPPVLTAAIYAETEGNAFFVEEVFRHLVDTGAVLDSGGHFRTDLSIGELQVPENVRLVIDQRLDRLSDGTRRMLTIAAVIGRRFSFELLEAADDLPLEALLDAVDEAQSSGLIGPNAQEQAEFSFSHELIRQALQARLSTPRRQRIHLRVASALERIHGKDAPDRSADIAHHLVHAGAAADRMKTAEYLTLAGDRAVTATGFEEALRHFTAALNVLPRDEVRRRADLLLRIGRAQRSLSQWDDTVATWKEALPTLESLGDVEAVADLCYELSYQLGWAYRMPESLAVANRGLDAIGDLQGPHRTRLLAVAAAGLTMSNRFEEARTRLGEASDLATSRQDTSLLGEVGFVELFYKYSTMQLREAVEPGRRAERTLRAARSPWHLAGVLAFLNVAAVFQGHFEESDAIERELYRWRIGSDTSAPPPSPVVASFPRRRHGTPT